jgi:HSP20 family protein
MMTMQEGDPLTKLAANLLVDELMVMKQRMDTLYAESFGATREQTESPETTEDWEPAMDIVENEDAWMALIDLPGVADEDLQLEIESTRLTIKGVRRRSGTRANAQVVQSECPIGRFSRAVTLPETAAREQVKAELSNGVLTIEIPNNGQTARKIPVRSA